VARTVSKAGLHPVILSGGRVPTRSTARCEGSLMLFGQVIKKSFASLRLLRMAGLVLAFDGRSG